MSTVQVVGAALLLATAFAALGGLIAASKRRRRRSAQVRSQAIDLLGDLALNSAKAQSELAEALADIRSDTGPGLAEKLPRLASTGRRHEQRLGTAQEGLSRLAGAERPLAAAAVEVAKQRDRVGALCRTAEHANPEEPDAAVAAITTAVTDVLKHERLMRDTVDDAKHRLLTRAAQLAGAERDPLKDPLTQLPNRRALLAQAADPENGHASRPYAVAVFGVKSPTDAEAGCGTAANDAIVAVAARVIRDNARPSDFVARTGEREFAVLMPGADAAAASYVARSCRRVAGSTGVQLPGRTASFSLTWGVAASKPGLATELVLAEAREAESTTPAADPGRLLSRSAGTVVRKPAPEPLLV